MSLCSRCGAPFACAMADPGDGAPCWCTLLPAAAPLPPPAAAGCWCPACLRGFIAAAEAEVRAKAGSKA
ncbi:MAG TPA: cysteine-rich CWC family protein [Janthinobacterium sp.]|jgi:hypothetical protein|nr:cysteine-rich CWC family protein [Janthinobacterium sp.]